MDKMGEINREMLLGYLMNALEDDEMSRVRQELLRQPELRDELAKLHQELSPLSSVYETVEPPRNLARRTCDRIWAHAEREERAGEFADAAGIGRIVSLSLPLPHFNVSSDMPDDVPMVSRPDRFQVVEELVAASPHLSEPTVSEEGPKRLTRQREKKDRSLRRSSRRSSRKAVGKSRKTKRGRWVDVFAATGVGILIALLVFPAINFSKNKIHSHLAQSKMREINQNVEHYTASQVMAEEPASPQNFFHYGWQEIKPDRIPLLVVDETENSSSDVEPMTTPSTDATLLATDESQTEPLAEPFDDGVLLGQSSDRGMIFGPMQQIGLNEPTEPAGQSIFSNVGQLMPVSNSPMLQPAYGQNVIFHNGRIFVRRLPEVTPSE